MNVLANHIHIISIEYLKVDTMEETRIYIADLACYNNGILSGRWIDLPSEDIAADVQMVLDSGTRDRIAAGVYDGVPSEEYAIHDSELPFAVDEYDDIVLVNDKVRTLENLSEYDQKKINYLTEWQGEDFSRSLELLDEVELYEDTTLTELAEQFVDEGYFGSIPDSPLSSYINYEAIGRDLSFDYVDVDGDLFRAA